MSHWHIGNNTPGYLCDTEPYCFNGSFTDAREAVQEEAQDYAWPVLITDESGKGEIQFRVSSVTEPDRIFFAVAVEPTEECRLDG